MGAVLSIDYGTKRVGLAASDATRAYVFPRDTMLRSTPTEEAAYLRALCREDGIDLLAVGLPLNADGTEGPMAMAARKYSADLTSALQVPHVLVDERYTSQEAEEHLRVTYPRVSSIARAWVRVMFSPPQLISLVRELVVLGRVYARGELTLESGR